MPHPRVSRKPPTQGRWLVKPLKSAGGRGITFHEPTANQTSHAKVYFQEFIEGLPCSAVYIGADGRAELLGVTRQLIGEKWLGAMPFHYCGSVGPLRIDAATTAAFEKLGNTLAKSFGLRGLFGIDCILKDNVPWPVEVNPRYTASVEVLELATGFAALAKHRRVFDPDAGDPASFSWPHAGMVAKAIVFARSDIVVQADAPWAAALAQPPLEWRDFGDIPHAGERIEAGQPVVTLFARGADEVDCLNELQDRVQALDRWLYGG